MIQSNLRLLLLMPNVHNYQPYMKQQYCHLNPTQQKDNQITILNYQIYSCSLFFFCFSYSFLFNFFSSIFCRFKLLFLIIFLIILFYLMIKLVMVMVDKLLLVLYYHILIHSLFLFVTTINFID